MGFLGAWTSLEALTKYEFLESLAALSHGKERRRYTAQMRRLVKRYTYQDQKPKA